MLRTFDFLSRCVKTMLPIPRVLSSYAIAEFASRESPKRLGLWYRERRNYQFGRYTVERVPYQLGGLDQDRMTMSLLEWANYDGLREISTHMLFGDQKFAEAIAAELGIRARVFDMNTRRAQIMVIFLRSPPDMRDRITAVCVCVMLKGITWVHPELGTFVTSGGAMTYEGDSAAIIPAMEVVAQNPTLCRIFATEWVKEAIRLKQQYLHEVLREFLHSVGPYLYDLDPSETIASMLVKFRCGRSLECSSKNTRTQLWNVLWSTMPNDNRKCHECILVPNRCALHGETKYCSDKLRPLVQNMRDVHRTIQSLREIERGIVDPVALVPYAEYLVPPSAPPLEK